MGNFGLRNFARKDDGNVAVEFAFVAPLLILVIIGIVDFGMYINQKMQLENMARSAAEYVVKGGDENAIQVEVLASGMAAEDIEEVDAQAENTCECSDGEEISCSATCSDGGYKRQFFTYSLTRTFTPAFPYPGIPDQITMTGNARMQVQ